jgi:hypothetical protein
MPIKNIVKNTWKLVKVMKNDELNLANEPETKPIIKTPESVSALNPEQPKWFNNVSGVIKLFHEMFSAVRTGILPILLFCFLFIPSFISSGVGIITTEVNKVLDKLSANGQSASVSGTGISVVQQYTKPEEKVITDALSKSGQTVAFNKDGNLGLTFSQLKIVGNELEQQKITSPTENKLIDTTSIKIVDALSSFSNANNSATNSQIDGWTYLGRAKNKETMATEGITINKTAIQDLKINQTVTFTDGVYLRKEEQNCNRTKGEIINAIPVGESVTLLSDAVICPTTNSVWAKVKRN